MTNAKSVRHSKKMVAAWEQCEIFNSMFPVGTRVKYYSLIDQATEYDIKETRTRSEAWALPSGESVVMLEGKAGGCSLDHVEVIR